MIKKLKEQNGSYYLLLTKDVRELTGIGEWVEIVIENELIVLRAAKPPKMNGLVKDVVV